MEVNIKTLSLCVIFFFLALVVDAEAIGFVQINAATPQTPQSIVTVTYTSTQVAGDLNVVVVGWNDSAAVVTSVTDTKGNVYQLAVGPTVRAGVASQSIYYANNIAGAVASGNSVTIRFSVAAAYPDIRILEYNGLDKTNPLDVVKAATGTNKTSNSGAVATTNANDLLFAANLVQTSTRAAGTGFASRIITFPNGDIAEDRIVTAIGNYGATAPLTSAGPWIMQMVAFKAGTPDLAISKTHTGNFTQGQAGATYTISVSNVGSAPTTGPVTVVDILPSGLTATALSGTGWTCTLSSLTCTRNDVLAVNASYPAVTLTVNVDANAPASVINTATVSGGGDNSLANNTSGDVTSVSTTAPAVTINQASSQTDPTNVSPINFTVIFSTSVTGFNSGGVIVGGTAGGTKSVVVTGSGTTYNVAVSGMTSNGTVIATVSVNAAQDTAGNGNTASTSTDNSVTYAGITAPGFVAAYSFDEGIGTTVADATGNGNTGTIANANWTSGGKYGNALVFNGTNALVTINDSASLHLTTAMTLEAWVNPSAVNSAWRDVIYKGSDNYYLEATSSSSGVPVGGGTFGAAGKETYGTAALAVNTWSHLAVTYRIKPLHSHDYFTAVPNGYNGPSRCIWAQRLLTRY